MKKILYILSFLVLSFILVACDKDDIESFEIVTKNEVVELYQGETIDYNDFELILHYKDGTKKSIINEKELKAVKHNYNVYPNFNHFDPNDNEVIQEVIFEYKNFKTEIVPIKTKRLEVKKVTLLNIGKTSYQYGELFDPADFSVFVEFTNAPNRQLPLTVDMLNIESSQLKPEEIGTYYVDIAFNGVKANNPLVLNISKGERVLSKEDVKIVDFNENYIELEPINNALYAFYKADEVPAEEDIEWQDNNIFQSDKLITDDYVVFVKVIETKHYLESNIVSHYINYHEKYIKPNVLYVGDNNIIIAHVDGFDVVLLDENNKIIGRYYEISNDLKTVKIDRLNPNTFYKLAFVRSGTNDVYEQNILDTLVKTKEGTNVIIAKHSQTNTFANKKISYEYLINEKYNSDNLKVDIKYYNENNKLVEPINAGTYKVVITNNFSSEKLERTLEIKKLDIELTINNVTKIYGENDVLTYTLDNENFRESLNAKLSREEGENVGSYQIVLNSFNEQNFNILVNDATLEILPRNLNITADPATKIYGDIDPILSYQIEGLQFDDEFDIILSRQLGENIGTYEINLDSTNISENYTINFITSEFEILKRNILISTNNYIKTYGDNDPSYEFEIINNSDLTFASELNFEIIRDNNENVGTYKLDINNKNDNFNVYLNNDYYLSIEPLKIVVTVNNIKVVYGTAITQNLFTNDLTNDKLPFNDKVEDLGEIIYETNAQPTEVGIYDVFVQKGYENKNYEFTYVPGTIEIEYKPVVFKYENLVTTYDKTLKSIVVKIYDSITNEEIEDAVVSVEYDGTPINAGVYQITATFSGSNMYEDLVDNSQKLVISKRDVQLTFDESSLQKVYGSKDNIKYTLENVIVGDELDIEVIRENNENVGSYPITINTNNTNYNIIYENKNFEIIKKDLFIKPHQNSKVYGEEDPQLTFDIEGLIDNGVIIEITYNGKNVGTYDYKILVLENADNYNIILDNTNKFTIEKRDLFINAETLVYNGLDQNVQLIINNIYNNDDVSFEQLTVKDAGTYDFDLIISGNDKDNYNYPTSINIVVEKYDGNVKVEGDSVANDLPVIELDYKDNQVKQFNEFTKFKVVSNNNLGDFTNDFTYSFNVEYLDLSAGASTFIVTVTAITNNPNFSESINFTQDIVYKFKSVLVNDDYFTIEDALEQSGNLIIVAYNTSFANEDVANIVYGNTNYEVKEGKTLLLPMNNKHSTSLDNYNNEAVHNTRTPYVELVIPSNINIEINGTMTVNAYRSTGGDTQFMGFTDFSAYSAIRLLENTNIYVNGELNVIGYIYGEGNVIANSNSIVKEPLFIKSFRGGTVTSGIYSELFPFNQYTANNIEANFIINSGASYKLLALVRVSILGHQGGELPLIGNDNDFVMKINSGGSITKSYNQENGDVTIDINGDVELNHATVKISVTASSKNLDLPFDGNWNFNLNSGSKLTINDGAWIGFLPGSKVNINEGSFLDIKANGKVSIIPPNTFDDFSKYPNSFESYYRVKPTINYNKSTPAEVNIAGEVLVHEGGTLAGNYTVLDTANIEYSKGSKHTNSYKYLTENKADSFGYIYINSDVIYNIERELSLIIDAENNEIVNFNIKFSDHLGNGISNQTFDFTIENTTTTYTTDEFGYVNVQFPVGNWSEEQEILYVIEYFLNERMNDIYEQFSFIHEIFRLSGKQKYEGVESDGEMIEATLELREGYTLNPLPNIDINLEITQGQGNANLESTLIQTDIDGKASFNITFNKNGSSARTIKVTAKATYLGVEKELEITFNQDASSPFIYSEDEYGELYFEHQPLPFKLVKTVEGTSYGTLRLLQDQDGVYYVQIVEEGTSTTMLNNLQLFAVDYIDDGSVLDLFFDIAGNPHTIREKLRPVSFVDNNGNDYLLQINDKDGNVAKIEDYSNTYSSFTATFNRNNNSDFAKLMFSAKVSDQPHQLFLELFRGINGSQNMWWLDRAFMNNELHVSYIENVFNSLKIQVQVWDGNNWITQAYVEPTPYLMEEYLVYLDLTAINSEQVKVRFLFATSGGYEFDSVSIDFTENLPMIIHTMTLESAILNNEVDVLEKLLFNNNQYVALDYKDGVRFGFTAPELEEGYSRGFGVATTGYVYAQHAQTDDLLLEQMEGKTFEEIKQIIIDSGRQELIDDIPIVEEFYYTILYIGSQEYETLLELLFSSLNLSGEDD